MVLLLAVFLTTYPNTTMFESTCHDSDLEATCLPTFDHTSESYSYAVTHVFLPVQLPRKKTTFEDLSLVRAVRIAAHAYTLHVYGSPEEDRWHRITKMLDNLLSSVQSERLDKNRIISQLPFGTGSDRSRTRIWVTLQGHLLTGKDIEGPSASIVSDDNTSTSKWWLSIHRRLASSLIVTTECSRGISYLLCSLARSFVCSST